MALLQGVDGCRGGWLVVSADWGPGGWDRFRWQLEPQLSPWLGAELGAITAIDMPIGLAAAAARPCDLLARQRLGARRSSVFPAPVRAALQASDYPTACAISQAACGKKISKQSFNLLPKIRQLDQLLQADSSLQMRVHEVHPELAFSCWNGGVPMGEAKKTAAGASQRRIMVEAEFPGLALNIRAQWPSRLLANDDILDALACLWSARRIHQGMALRLGGELDATGLSMSISA
jgi:predicted RNase H-like nuclease